MALAACGAPGPLLDDAGEIADSGVASDAGASVDAGTPAPVATCSSSQYWTRGNSGSPDMNPGLACRSCHLGQNFSGQNPTGVREPAEAAYFMGTVFAESNGRDRCVSPPVTNGWVDIIDRDGVVALSLPIRPGSGNFMSSSTTTNVALPYTAVVRANGRTRKMSSSQTDGDCNTCHTEFGRNAAPGRIVLP